MACDNLETEWEWVTIDRRSDVNINAGGVLTRQNWTGRRQKYTTDIEYDSQLGEYAENVSALLGDKHVSMIPPVKLLDYCSFVTDRNWNSPHYKYLANYGTSWVGRDGIGRLSYHLGPDYANLPDSSKTTIIKPVLVVGTDGWQWKWQAGEWDKNSRDWMTTYTYTPGARWGYAINQSKSIEVTTVTVSDDADVGRYRVSWLPLPPDPVQGDPNVGVWKDGVPVFETNVNHTSNGSFVVPQLGTINFKAKEVGEDYTGSFNFTITRLNPIDTTPTNRIETALTTAERSALPPDPPKIDGMAFVTNYGTFVGTSNVTLNNESGGVLFCAGDSMVFQKGMPWALRVQDWIYKEAWK